jgi:hypothetical protein
VRSSAPRSPGLTTTRDQGGATGDTSTYDWGDHLDIVRAAVACGVTFRRVRVVSEPLSEYMLWEHACTGTNVQAGEDVRWLPRTNAADLLLPCAWRRSCTPWNSPAPAEVHRRYTPGTEVHLRYICALTSRYASW